MAEPTADVFLTISAQEDNLGDIEIRQQMINMVSHPSVRLHISRGDMSDSYVEAFDFPPNSIVYKSKHRQTVELIRSIVRGRASVVFPPGPYPATSTRSAVRAFGSLIVTLAAQARGGASITVGKSVRGQHRLAIAAERRLSVRSKIYVARDRKTAVVLGVPVRSAPDVAMLDYERPESASRKIVAMSLRYDGTENDNLVRALADWADSCNLDVVLVSQVRRDDSGHRALAEKYDLGLLEWQDESHRTQMERVRSLYAQSALVITDRLHAALFGAVNGAVPVALIESGRPSKIRDAFDTVLPVFEVDRSQPDHVALQTALTGQERLADALCAASASLRALRADVADTLSCARASSSVSPQGARTRSGATFTS